MKQTLYARLLEVCHDTGIDTPRNRDIQELIGVSSGRVTQIKQEETAAAIGEASMARLVARGYRRDWIKNGTLPKRQDDESDTADPTTDLVAQGILSPEALAVAHAYEAASDDLRTALRALTRAVLSSDDSALPGARAPKNREYPPDIDDVLPGTPSAFNPNVSIRGHVTHEPKAQDYHKRKTDR